MHKNKLTSTIFAAPSTRKPCSSPSCTPTTNSAPSNRSKKSATSPKKPTSTSIQTQCNPPEKFPSTSIRSKWICSPSPITNFTHPKTSTLSTSATARACTNCFTINITNTASTPARKMSQELPDSAKLQSLRTSLSRKTRSTSPRCTTNCNKVSSN